MSWFAGYERRWIPDNRYFRVRTQRKPLGRYAVEVDEGGKSLR